MADIRRYQPRHSRSGSPIGRRLIIGVIILVGLVIIVRAFQGGKKEDSTNSVETNTEEGIRLRNENSAVANTNAVTNGNTNADVEASETNSNLNTNAAVAVAPDGSDVDLTACTQALSSFGTRKVMALTFNLAATNDQVDVLLNVLTKDKIAASFFTSGTFAEKNPDIVRKVSAKGFAVYNRSYDNPRFGSLNASQVTAQLEQAESAISGVTDRSTKPFFRPPFGESSETSTTAAHDAGYCTILWSVDALDWQNDATAASAKARVVEKARNGGIVMLSAGYDVTAEATRSIATDLRKSGYTLVSLVELLGS